MSIKKQIVLRVQLNTRFGQNVYISGNTEELGMWDIHRAVPMHWEGDGHSFWGRSVIFDFPLFSSKSIIEYKYFVAYDDELRRGEVHWEKAGQNRTLDASLIKVTSAASVVVDTWGDIFCFSNSDVGAVVQKTLFEYEYERNLAYKEHVKKLSSFFPPCTKDQIISCIWKKWK